MAIDERRSIKSGSNTFGNRGAAGDYTAIIYFHGMGTPRRHEEISCLIDAFDQYSERQDKSSVGRLRDQDVEFEPSRTDGDDDVAFVRLTRIVERFGNKSWREGDYRIYEGFWSPSTAGGYSSIRVLAWLLLRIASPFRVLWRPWRAHQRLKLATLYRMYSLGKPNTDLEHYRQLESHYRNFENWPARRRYTQGRYGDFLRYLDAKLSVQPAVAKTVRELADAWHRRFIREQILVILNCITAIVATFDLALIVAYLVRFWLILIGVFPRWGIKSFADSDFPSAVFSIGLIALSILFPILIVAVRHQLSNFWADVMFWTTQKEKDTRFTKRREILKAGENILQHVLRDPACKRVVVIGHSLGSAIAYETLMRLGRRLLARTTSAEIPTELTRMNIISHLITVGSPIDWIHYFFDLHDSKYHRYNRISERLRGDTSDPPFKSDKRGGTEWVNVWDDADLISSRLYSPRKRIPNQTSISDIKAISSHRPNFGTAHSSYMFSSEAMHIVFWISMFGRLPKKQISGVNRLGTLMRGTRPIIWVAIGMLPWSALALISGLHFHLRPLAWTGEIVVATCLAMLAFAHFLGAIMDGQRPLRIDQLSRDQP